MLCIELQSGCFQVCGLNNCIYLTPETDGLFRKEKANAGERKKMDSWTVKNGWGKE